MAATGRPKTPNDALHPKRLPAEQVDRIHNYPPDEQFDGVNSRSDFWVPSADEKGQKVTLSFNVPPAVMRQMEVLLAGDKFPYYTASDMIRHAVVRHIEFLVRVEPGYSVHFLAGLKAMTRAISDSHYRQETSTLFQKLTAQVDVLLQAGERNEAVRLIGETRHFIQGVARTVWSRELETMFDQKYGHYLRPVVEPPRMPLGITDGSEDEGEGEDEHED